MARQRRFLVESLSSNEVRLNEEESHHLLHVLRLNEGDEIVLFDGKGLAARAVIESTRAREVRARQLERLSSNESSQELTLALVVPKTAVMTEIVRHATELGVTHFLPLTSDHAQIPLKSLQSRVPRWRRTAIEACKQSGRSSVPTFDEPQSFRTAVASASSGVTLVTVPETPPLEWSGSPPASASVFVGPEGGWTEQELGVARDAGARAFGLGPRTFKVETAALAAVTLVQYLMGDLGPS